MTIRSDNLLAQYQNYDPSYQAGFTAMPIASGASSGIAGALPVVGAAMQGVGILSNLYGAYQANKQANRQYRLQREEFERQKKMEAEDRAINAEELARQNAYDSAGYVGNSGDNRLAKYANYFRGINL